MPQPSIQQEFIATRPRQQAHVIADKPEVLPQILQAGVNLCLWQRPIQKAIVKELAGLEPTDLPDVRCVTSRESFDQDVVALMRQQGLDPLSFPYWRADLRQLADCYFELSQDREVTLRLVTTDEDNCRRFHVDRTHLRLLCTYQGPGTEWLSNDQVDRLAQTSGAPNEAIVRFGEPAEFAGFDVGIMKGDAFPGNAGQGLVHRSPPIERARKKRVLLCLDC